MAYQKKHERGDREDRGEFPSRRRPAPARRRPRSRKRTILLVVLGLLLVAAALLAFRLYQAYTTPPIYTERQPPVSRWILESGSRGTAGAGLNAKVSG